MKLSFVSAASIVCLVMLVLTSQARSNEKPEQAQIESAGLQQEGTQVRKENQKQESGKKSKRHKVIGVITKVVRKHQKIIVVPRKPGQQIQAQQDLKRQDNKRKRAGRLVFLLDDQTSVSEPPNESSSKDDNVVKKNVFDMLAVDQLVEVVYVKTTESRDHTQSEHGDSEAFDSGTETPEKVASDPASAEQVNEDQQLEPDSADTDQARSTKQKKKNKLRKDKSKPALRALKIRILPSFSAKESYPSSSISPTGAGLGTSAAMDTSSIVEE